MRIISPRFYKRPPKNWGDWLKPGYKSKYTLQYPLASKIFGVIAALLFLLPSALLVYSFIVLSRDGIEIFGPIAGLGMIGSMMIGLGLASIVAAFIHTYLGHIATGVLVLIGLIFLLITYLVIFL